MKKRNHTYQIEGKISQSNLNANISTRSQRNRQRSLRPSTYSAPYSIAKSQSSRLNHNTLAISNQLSDSELKTFTFRCIESMANLANFDQGQTNDQVLANLVKESLPAFVTLIDQLELAQNELEEYKERSKKIVRNLKPLIDQPSSSADRVDQLTQQAVQCVERRMLSKYTVQTLAERIDSITQSIPHSVRETGEELQLPANLISKLANQVKNTLTNFGNTVR